MNRATNTLYVEIKSIEQQEIPYMLVSSKTKDKKKYKAILSCGTILAEEKTKNKKNDFFKKIDCIGEYILNASKQNKIKEINVTFILSNEVIEFLGPVECQHSLRKYMFTEGYRETGNYLKANTYTDKLAVEKFVIDNNSERECVVVERMSFELFSLFYKRLNLYIKHFSKDKIKLCELRICTEASAIDTSGIVVNKLVEGYESYNGKCLLMNLSDDGYVLLNSYGIPVITKRLPNIYKELFVTLANYFSVEEKSIRNLFLRNGFSNSLNELYIEDKKIDGKTYNENLINVFNQYIEIICKKDCKQINFNYRDIEISEKHYNKQLQEEYVKDILNKLSNLKNSIIVVNSNYFEQKDIQRTLLDIVNEKFHIEDNNIKTKTLETIFNDICFENKKQQIKIKVSDCEYIFDVSKDYQENKNFNFLKDNFLLFSVSLIGGENQ